jgi:DNA repair protein RadC
MQTLSALSRAELVSALLAPPDPAGDHVADLEPRYRSFSTELSADPRSPLVSRKLAIARELLLRDLCALMRIGPVMDSPQVLRDWLRLHCVGLEHEVFIVIYLDATNRLIAADEMFRGTLTQTSVYPREIVKSALDHNAAAVAFAHNHPSGSPEPSRADQQLTLTLKTTLALIDVRVIDHFVVAGDRICSFAERGLV